MDKSIDLLLELANSLFGLTVWCIETIINNNGLKFYIWEPNDISCLLINNLLLTYMTSLTSKAARATEI